jgi:antitoxin component HigA of HigAB toxin-antitoxin module
MEIKPIKTETGYHAALKEIERLFAAAPDTREGDRLDVLTTLVEAYEEQHCRTPCPIQSRRSCITWKAGALPAAISNRSSAVAPACPKY